MPVRRSPVPDVLSDVLGLLEPRSEVVCMSRFTAPWGIRFSRMVASFHVIEHGSCVVHVDGSLPIVVSKGDLVILPKGLSYSIADAKKRKLVAYEAIVGPDARQADRLRDYGGGGTETSMMCGISRVQNPAAAPLLAALPPSILVRRSDASSRWLDTTTSLLLHEAAASEPGSEIAVSRLLDLMFVYAIRVWLEGLPKDAPGGWLNALRDRRIGIALATMHAEPAHPWSVTELAERAGMSRSPFAARFTALIGEPPLRYLARLRLVGAARALTGTTASVREVSARFGYDAEEAFSRAFKRQFGVAPTVYRKDPSRVLERPGLRAPGAKPSS